MCEDLDRLPELTESDDSQPIDETSEGRKVLGQVDPKALSDELAKHTPEGKPSKADPGEVVEPEPQGCPKCTQLQGQIRQKDKQIARLTDALARAEGRA